MLLREFSSSWRGYDDASPALQAVMDAHNGAAAAIVRTASATLVAPEGVDFLATHATDPRVDHVLGQLRGSLSTPSWHRILLARPGRSEQHLGATHLLFLSHGLLVVVDGRHCYGPAKPPILAAVGHMAGSWRPGPRYVQLQDLRDQPVALDLELLQATEFQRPGVVRHTQTLQLLDEDGAVLTAGRTERRFTWGELAWSPLRPFEA